MKLPTLIAGALRGLGALCALLALASVDLPAQGITTSGLSGSVLSEAGSPLPGATVTIVHVPSGTVATTATRPNGRFDARGLRPGGPYTVTAEVSGFRAQTVEDVFITLENTSEVQLRLEATAVRMDVLVIEASDETVFNIGATGPGNRLTADQIAQVATTTRSLQDLIAENQFVTLIDKDRGEINALGQNFRYNNLLINGVPTNDPFGLNPGGFPSNRNPVALEHVEALNVEVAPYDVRRAGFTGALINAITRAGTNDFRGSLYGYYTDQDLRAKNPVLNVREEFEEKTWGAWFSGPIIQNKLFFFVGYENFERTGAPAQNLFVPDPATVTRLVNRISQLGYNPGTLGGTSAVQEDEQWNVRLDWNISDQHRLAASYRRSEGVDPNFFGFSGSSTTSFSNYWADQILTNESYVAQFFSNWTPSFQTEVSVSYSQYTGEWQNKGTPFPEIEVRGVPRAGIANPDPLNSAHWGSLLLGTERSRQINALETDNYTAAVIGEWFKDDHTLTFGADYESYDIINDFLQDRWGRYQLGRNPSGTTPAVQGLTILESPTLTIPSNSGTQFQAQRAAPGQSVIADWSYYMLGLFLQDSWRFNPNLTLTGGLRLDLPVVDDKPIFNPAVLTAFGRRNDATMDGNELLSPRFGFNWKVDRFERPTQVRGGYGLFQGRNPAVWMSNSYSNTGLTQQITFTNPPSVVLDPFNQPFTPATVRSNISLMSEKFRMPSVWRGNLAIDHELPFLGLVATAEVVRTDVENAIHYVHLNLRPATSGPLFLPDGRQRFAGATGRQRVDGFGEVVLLTNTNKGESTAYAIGVTRPMKDGWAGNLSYTWTKATEVSPGTSSIALSNWNGRAVRNPNEEVASTANYEVRDRVVASITRELEIFKRFPTRMTVTYEGRTGRPYSWTFAGDANGDNVIGNDLLYVPTGPGDPNVRFAGSSTETPQQMADRFFAFVNATEDLADYKGHVVARNSSTSPFNHQFDFRVTQEVPIWGRARAELIFDVLNFGNLINDEWGRIEQDGFPFFRNANVTAGLDAAANGGRGQYIYNFSNAGPEALATRTGGTSSGAAESRWAVQVGMRIRF